MGLRLNKGSCERPPQVIHSQSADAFERQAPAGHNDLNLITAQNLWSFTTKHFTNGTVRSDQKIRTSCTIITTMSLTTAGFIKRQSCYLSGWELNNMFASVAIKKMIKMSVLFQHYLDTIITFNFNYLSFVYFLQNILFQNSHFMWFGNCLFLI